VVRIPSAPRKILPLIGGPPPYGRPRRPLKVRLRRRGRPPKQSRSVGLLLVSPGRSRGASVVCGGLWLCRCPPPSVRPTHVTAEVSRGPARASSLQRPDAAPVWLPFMLDKEETKNRARGKTFPLIHIRNNFHLAPKKKSCRCMKQRQEPLKKSPIYARIIHRVSIK
jgi:hypothetical protein